MRRLTPETKLRMLAILLGLQSAWSLVATDDQLAARVLTAVVLAVIALGLLFRWRAFRVIAVVVFGLCAGFLVPATLFNLVSLLLPNFAELPRSTMEFWSTLGASIATAVLAIVNIGAALVLDGKQMKSVFRAS